jgi:hypothetical protein
LADSQLQGRSIRDLMSHGSDDAIHALILGGP